MTDAVTDPHRRTASIVYEISYVDVSVEQRQHGKVLNVLAAHGQLTDYKLCAELAGVSESDARILAQLFRERVLGITQGVARD